jgi:hypothetical protein
MTKKKASPTRPRKKDKLIPFQNDRLSKYSFATGDLFCNVVD